MVGISLACTPTRQPEMDLTIEMRPTFPVEVKLPSKKVQKPCNFEQLEMVDELDLRPFRSSFHSTCLARTTKTQKHGHDIKTRVGNGQSTRLVVFGVYQVCFFLISWCCMFLLASSLSRLADLVGSRTNVEIHNLY